MRYTLRISTLVCLATVVSFGGAQAAPVTIDFSGPVNNILDSMAPLFSGAKSVVGTLIFDNSVTDTEPALDTGRYPNSLISLTVEVTGLGLSWSTTRASLNTFPDSNPVFNDQFHVNNIERPSGSSVGGLDPLRMQIAFFGDNMLADDSLPGAPLNWTYSNFWVQFDDASDPGRVAGGILLAFPPSPASIAAPSSTLFLALLCIPFILSNRLKSRGNYCGYRKPTID